MKRLRGVLASFEGSSIAHTSGNKGEAYSPTDLFATIMSPADGLLATEESVEEEEVKVIVVWVCSCSSHCSAANIMEYGGRFMNIEMSMKLCWNECKNCFLKIIFSLICALSVQDIELRDSPILCLSMVGGKA